MPLNNELKYFHGFNLFPEIGALTFKKLLASFESLEKAWSASRQELLQADLRPKTIETLIAKRESIHLDRELEKVIQNNITLISIKDKEYPNQLKEIYDPPAVLYCRGQIKPQDEISLAVIGTRKLSNYGRQVTPPLVRGLIQSGLTIISGLAYGIDTLAHQTALETGGRTLAVIGSGVDDQSIYPSANSRLARQIIKQGALISEYPPGAPALKEHFPLRNRIISGLASGVLVVEAPEKSGALITAQYALNQNREIFAVPGSIYNENSQGTHYLIKMGAKLVNHPNDILEEINLPPTEEQTKQSRKADLTSEEAIILENLSQEPLHIDKIINLTKLKPSIVSAGLSMMELKGLIKNLGNMNYIKI